MKICKVCKKEYNSYNKFCCSKECSNIYRTENLIGQKFGRLTVISQAERLRKRSAWNCLCDCGNTKIVNSVELKNGNVKSCKCLAKETTSKLNIKPYGESSFNCLYSSYKRNAINRNYSFELTKDEFKKLVDGNCYYCDVVPHKEYTQNSNKTKVNGHYIYNGVDRLNNTIGYTISNSVSCCGQCNTMKLNYTKEEFLEHIKKILNYQNSRKEI